MSAGGTEGINAIMDAAKERYYESQREKEAGSEVWWRVSRGHYFFWVYNHLVCNGMGKDLYLSLNI